ncbi:MAG: DUF4062 domain-containing protein [Pseudomonadota bacterium]|nr:DUF4062 domain-containing protein [Pseudomonadota bacterium]
MIDKRYHVFISTTEADMHAERVVLSQTLVSQGFFSWGLEQRTPLTTAFARRQIDDCDYFVLMLGSRYGELSASGVSYMHLEYIYAVTKQKPILVLMYEAPENRSEQYQDSSQEGRIKFLDFRRQLQRERDMVMTFRDTRDLEMALRHTMPQLLNRYPAQGWVRPNQQQVQQLQEENEQLRQKLIQLESNPVRRPQDHRIPELPQVQGDEEFVFDYKVHAYQDGNFRELRPQRHMTWNDLLVVIGPGFSPAMPEDSFARIINEYLNQTALADVREVMPRAHAVARSQVNIRALHMIKTQFKNNAWIVPIGRDDRHRILWELSTNGERHLARLMVKQQLNTGA